VRLGRARTVDLLAGEGHSNKSVLASGRGGPPAMIAIVDWTWLGFRWLAEPGLVQAPRPAATAGI
jgi:hypothetical protein